MDKVEGEVQDLGGIGEETPEMRSGSAKAGDKMKKATDAQTKGAKDVRDTETTKIKEPLSQAMITSTMTVRNFKKKK